MQYIYWMAYGWGCISCVRKRKISRGERDCLAYMKTKIEKVLLSDILRGVCNLPLTDFVFCEIKSSVRL